MSYFVIITVILFCVSHTKGVDPDSRLFNKTKDIVLTADKTHTACAERKCIRKCCPKDQVVYNNNPFNDEPVYSCVDHYGETLNYSNIPVYDTNNLNKKTHLTLQDLFLLDPGRFNELLTEDKYPNTTFQNVTYDLQYLGINTVLSDEGVLYTEFRNAYKRWTPVKYFCVDYENDKIMPSFWFVDESQQSTKAHFSVALVISSFFLVIVLIVYGLLPELRNLVGMIVMACVLSLLGAFILLFTLQVADLNTELCIVITAMTYFCFLSTFCWMNVMSLDIWWTFRGYAKARQIHRRGEKFKFFMYCLYGWGLPLAMTIMLVIINSMELSDKPWFIKPLIPEAGCFLYDGQKLVYLYVPMLILILCNWIFFLLTAFNIWRLSRATAVVNSDAAGNPAAHRSQKNRFIIYLKLSLIMGVNWILEVVSYFWPDLQVWNITDMYNLLLGLAIFLIFVCKKKIYMKLRQRYYVKDRLHKTHPSSSTIESSLSQETPLQISTHPMGLKPKRSFHSGNGI